MSHSGLIRIGYRAGRLKVISNPTRIGDTKRYEVAVQCDCGVQKIVRTDNLQKSGTTRSCGCIRKDGAYKKYEGVHGKSGTKEHKTWLGMINRCRYPSLGTKKWYYDKKVTVAEEWLGPNGFVKFFEHIGEAPTKIHTLERIDNRKGYQPGNVRWATPKEQARNRSTSKLVTVKGVTKSLAEWVEGSNIKYHTVLYRLSAGWRLDDALSTPPHFHNRRPR